MALPVIAVNVPGGAYRYPRIHQSRPCRCGDGALRLGVFPQPLGAPTSQMTTLKDFIRHAELFGTECVHETAEDHLPPSQLLRLRVDLDRIDRDRKAGGRYSVGTRRRRSAAETQQAAVQLSVEGLTTAEIGSKLGITPERAQRLVKAR
jgi:hypothetical protein